MTFTIKDAYLKKHQKFILIITHINGLNIDSIINLLTIDLGLNVIKSYDYNYDQLNNKINKLIEEGINKNKIAQTFFGSSIAIIGNTFPSHLINFKYDLHIHISISKTKYYSIYPDKSRTDYDDENKLISNNKINKYFNIKDEFLNNDNNVNDNKLDEIFDYIIDYWHYDSYGQKRYTDKYTSSNKKSNLDNISSSEIEQISSSSKIEDLTDTTSEEEINNTTDTIDTISKDNMNNISGGYKIFYKNPMKRIKNFKYNSHRNL